MTAVWEDDFYTQGDKSTLLVALAIADWTRDEVGHIYYSVDALAQRARTSIRGVQDAIRILVKAGKLRVEYACGKNGTSRYTLLFGSSTARQPLRKPCQEAAPHSERRPRKKASENPPENAPEFAPENPAQIPVEDCTQYPKDPERSQEELRSSLPEPAASGRERKVGCPVTANPGKPTPKSLPEPTESGLQFAEWFRTLLPATMRLGANYRRKWARCFDELDRLDHRSPAEIRAVCEWARRDSFWAANFLSPLKLRKLDRSGIQHFDVFAARMRQSLPGHGPRSSVPSPRVTVPAYQYEMIAATVIDPRTPAEQFRARKAAEEALAV